MEKVFIIGGTSGIGLEISKQLKNSEIHNFSRTELPFAFKNTKIDLNEAESFKIFVSEFKKYKPTKIIFNSGIGLFKGIGGNQKKVQNIFNVNVINYIKIIEAIFEDLLLLEVGIIFTSSTAAYINGAYEAIYNSTKHALGAYIKSLQTELIDKNSKTYVTEFVMHATNASKMTKQNATIQEEEYLKEVVNSLLESFKAKEAQFIPKYEQIYKKVFKAYHNDAIEQGLYSIEYKRSKGVK